LHEPSAGRQRGTDLVLPGGLIGGKHITDAASCRSSQKPLGPVSITNVSLTVFVGLSDLMRPRLRHLIDATAGIGCARGVTCG